MIPFKYNLTLEKAAANHAKYETLNNHQGHNEIKNSKFFTGQSPQKRALNVGYKSKNISENISFNKPLIPSIDSLFTAIYHRFGFLSFDKNEIGFSLHEVGDLKSAVFVMGNSYLNEICRENRSLNPRRYYKNVCKNPNKKIDEKTFNHALNLPNSNIVVYPYENAQNISTFFSGETPDPVPSCKITANPISVQFDPKIKNIQMVDFKVYKETNELKIQKVITKQNDTNQRFNGNEFALFAKKPFEFNTTYKVVFNYRQKGDLKILNWSFTTKTPKHEYFVVNGGENLAIEADKKYNIFFMPKDCNDIIKNYKSSHPLHLKFSVSTIGTNFLSFEAKGLKDDKVTFETNWGDINLYLTSSSKDMENKNIKRYLLGVVLAILALLLMFYRRRS